MSIIARITLVILGLYVLVSCNQPPKYVGNLTDYPGDKEGLLRSYYEDGQLYEEAEFNSGKLDGFRKIYFPGGQLKIHEQYKSDIYHGTYVRYFEDGSKKVAGDYEEGVMTGIWTSYYQNGAIKDEVTMAGNLENGPFKEYHDNGKIKALGQYANGEFEQGLLQLFDTTGTLIRKMTCDTGICRTIWQLEPDIE